MQDAATTHASMLGVGYDDLALLQRTFMLSRLQIKIYESLPTWEDEIELKTWTRGLNRLLALRDYELCKHDGTPFLKATTAWLLIDTQRHRPARPHDALHKIKRREVSAIAEDAPHKLQWCASTQMLEFRQARASDLDPNGHVNNTRYIDWITDAIAQYKGIETSITNITLNFLSEIQLGQKVKISVCDIEPGTLILQGESNRPNFCAKVQFRGKK